MLKRKIHGKYSIIVGFLVSCCYFPSGYTADQVEQSSAETSADSLEKSADSLEKSADSAETNADVDIESITKKWKCKYCPYPDQATFNTEVELGLGYVTNDSFKHGDYTGLNEKGAYLIGAANGNFKGKDAGFYNFDITDLGLDSRILQFNGGTQGLYDINVVYNQIPKYNSDTSKSPYSGDASQTLSMGWQTAPTTPGFSTLASDLSNRDIYTMRRDFSIGATYHQSSTLSYDLRFQRMTKKGYLTIGSVLGGNIASAKSVILAEPVDYITDIAEASFLYSANRLRGKLSYQASLFSNDSQTLRWQNAYSEPIDVSEGQQTSAPDNDMHQISLSGAYDLFDNTTASALLSIGRMRQNDPYTPYSINNNISPAPVNLPKDSLDGQINTYVGNFNLLSRVTPKLQLNFKYAHQEQDNATERATYDYVVADTSPSTSSRSNLPYSFRKRTTQLMGQYALPARSAVSLGVDYETYDRTYQEVSKTTENSYWAKLKSRPHQMVDIMLTLEKRVRDGNGYSPVVEVLPPENLLLRKYNLANRDRNKAGVAVNLIPLESLSIGLAIDSSNDDYTDSTVGLTGSKEKSYTIDASLMLTKLLSLNGFYTLETINSSQAGSQTAATPDWYSDNEDKIDTAGIGMDLQLIEDKFNVGFDFTHAQSNGKVNIKSQTEFSDLKTKRDTLELFSQFHFSPDLLFKFAYRYEKYDEANWAVDGVVPNTLDNVLSTGELSPNYDIGVFAASVRYKF